MLSNPVGPNANRPSSKKEEDEIPVAGVGVGNDDALLGHVGNGPGFPAKQPQNGSSKPGSNHRFSEKNSVGESSLPNTRKEKSAKGTVQDRLNVIVRKSKSSSL